MHSLDETWTISGPEDVGQNFTVLQPGTSGPSMLCKQNYTKTDHCSKASRNEFCYVHHPSAALSTQLVQLSHCRLALQDIRWLSAHNLQSKLPSSAHMYAWQTACKAITGPSQES